MTPDRDFESVFFADLSQAVSVSNGRRRWREAAAVAACGALVAVL